MKYNSYVGYNNFLKKTTLTITDDKSNNIASSDESLNLPIISEEDVDYILENECIIESVIIEDNLAQIKYSLT